MKYKFTQQYRKGMLVRCIKNSGCGGFVTNEIYIISEDSDHMCLTEIDSKGTPNGWSGQNFLIVDENRKHTSTMVAINNEKHRCICPKENFTYNPIGCVCGGI